MIQIICYDELLLSVLDQSLKLSLNKTIWENIELIEPLIPETDVNFSEFYFSQAMKYVCETKQARKAIVVGIDIKDTCGFQNPCPRLNKTVVCLPHPIHLSQLFSNLNCYEPELPKCPQTCSVLGNGHPIYAEKFLKQSICHDLSNAPPWCITKERFIEKTQKVNMLSRLFIPVHRATKINEFIIEVNRLRTLCNDQNFENFQCAYKNFHDRYFQDFCPEYA